MVQEEEENWSFSETPQEKHDREVPSAPAPGSPRIFQIALHETRTNKWVNFSTLHIYLGRHKAGSLQQTLQPLASTVTQFAM